MIRALVVGAAAALLLAAVPARGAAQEEVTIAECGCAATLTGTIQSNEEILPTPYGDARAVLRLVAPEGGDRFYLFGCVVYPGSYAGTVSTDAELDANRDNFLKGFNGQLVREERVQLAGRPGRAFVGRAEGPAGAIVTYGRIYYQAPRAYMIVVMMPDDRQEAEAVAFLDTFHFVGE